MHRILRHRPRSAVGAPRSRAMLLSVLLVAQLMVIIDISAVNVALPDLAKDLQIAGGDIGWAITSYSLLFGSRLLLGGRAADLLGRRRLFLAGLGVFTISSLASALAGSAAALFAARAGQGVGAAMLSPAALSIITTTFQGRDRARALGAWGAVSGAGAAVGVLLGGVLTQLADWRAIFVINLPVAVALASVPGVVPADSRRPAWRGLDLRGAVVATASLAALVYAMSQAADAGWGSAQTLGFGLAGLSGLALFAAVEAGAATPLLRVTRLADRAVGGGFLLMLIGSGVLFGTFLLSSVYLQDVLGAGPLETGLAFLPFAVTAALGAHVGSGLAGRFGVRATMGSGFAVTAAAMLLLSGVDRDGSYLTDVLPGLVVAGLGLGTVLASVAISVLTGARPEETGMLSGLNTTGHEIGGTLGIAVLVTIASAGSASALGPAGADGIATAFLAAGALAALGSLLAVIVLPSARSFLPRLRLAPRSMAIH
jgi:EmrB/QacA subfamily drug resistance transporter